MTDAPPPPRKKPFERLADAVLVLSRRHPALDPIREATGRPVTVGCHPEAIWLWAVPRRDKPGAFHYEARIEHPQWEPSTWSHAAEVLDELARELRRQWDERGGLAVDAVQRRDGGSGASGHSPG